ncbi:winged helix-turn-helix domain-containing protein [Streptomyces himalayensis]|uniref:Winged helix-turn-helix transcriptional regulator n=1 Tax=Streptomyces himalayensis subsp. himalayensis TaxID=2756131 RepID=A0A7W0DNS3_9ACTN|nr:winged helix-turn-helix domain-containing protein [Streptomyces himalayensis]MBA2948494.1 winged helix-turn-helix transcriptional regulator [Streptomyces himalayensis subsp. himalayensis]
MANTRSFSTANATTATAVTAAAAPAAAQHPARHRLRAVDRDEVVDVADFLPPGATWLPAPQHTLPTLPGRPPMIGYLVLVPADQQGVLPFPVPEGQAEQPSRRLVGQPAVAGAQDPHDAQETPEPGTHEQSEELVRIDTAQRTAEVDGRPLDLTYLEFELLAHLVAHPHRVHTRDQLVTTVWGYGHVGDGRTVDVHIARLRRKLGAQHRQAIQTVRRVGYKYTPPTAG